MSTALYQKDTASRLRAQLRRKAISLYYGKSPKMTFEDVAKKMQLPQKYIEKWINRYEKTGLHGYVGQRQSAILCIYKKNPNITLSQLRILLKKVGIVLSNSELGHILKSLKHILTDPMFKSASEEQILKKLAKVTKVQAKSVIRMNQKMKLERDKEDGGGKEHPHAQVTKSIYLDHNYVSHPDLSYDENDYSLYDKVDKLTKYKTDLMNKIATVSDNLDKLFDSEGKIKEESNHKKMKYKISLLREQILYLCLEMKGPKLSIEEITQNLPLTRTMVSKWIEQAKSIKRYVHAKHVNKCCGKIQESIVRLVKLNSELKTEDIKNILHNVNIDLSNLKLERQLNSVKYMINGPEDFMEKDHEEIMMQKDDIDYCIKVLSLKISSINLNKPKRKKFCNIIEKSNSQQLSLQSIVDSFNSNKHTNLSSVKIISDHIYQNSPPISNLINNVKTVRLTLPKELTNMSSNDPNDKSSQSLELLNYESINTEVKKRFNGINGKINGLNLLQAVTFNEMAMYGITRENNKEKGSPVVVEYSNVSTQSNNKIVTSECNEDVSLLQSISMIPNDFSTQHKGCSDNKKEQQIQQLEVIEETVCSIDLDRHIVFHKDAVKENTSPNLGTLKEYVFCNKQEQVNHPQTNTNLCNLVIEETMLSKSVENFPKVVNEEVISNVSVVEKDNEITLPLNTQGNITMERIPETESFIVNETELVEDISKKVTDNVISDTPLVENISEEVEEESGIGSLILDNKIHEDDEEEDLMDENMVGNTSASSDEYTSYKERKRKYSENDILESDESEFEPIDDLSFIGLDSDSDTLVREETDDSEKEIMTEYIECEDNSVVIKYWLAT
ncbi:uncharacterized protein LOC106644385 [Copidosoma floridanum]|uniref:uncharacterized protein LOC106644385 n=1 Tax=Copidosoma floridanum TaxID=29053 RepID=UPI0006C9ABD1|nr:uncharacterized protein LOC106644385 [Copidosoma floridanum]